MGGLVGEVGRGMSDGVLSVIPTDPHGQPDRPAAERATTLVTVLTGGLAVDTDVEADVDQYDALDFDRPCAFARFEIAVGNPEPGRLTDEQLAAVAKALGHPVRRIRAHL